MAGLQQRGRRRAGSGNVVAMFASTSERAGGASGSGVRVVVGVGMSVMNPQSDNQCPRAKMQNGNKAGCSIGMIQEGIGLYQNTSWHCSIVV